MKVFFPDTACPIDETVLNKFSSNLHAENPIQKSPSKNILSPVNKMTRKMTKKIFKKRESFATELLNMTENALKELSFGLLDNEKTDLNGPVSEQFLDTIEPFFRGVKFNYIKACGRTDESSSADALRKAEN